MGNGDSNKKIAATMGITMDMAKKHVQSVHVLFLPQSCCLASLEFKVEGIRAASLGMLPLYFQPVATPNFMCWALTSASARLQ